MEKKIEYRLVDLGLQSGLKWADRNVGAASPEAYGDYFMWGSITPDTNNVCDWAHAPFNGGSKEFDEAYFNEHKSEWLTGEGILKPEYDAAHIIMGGNWRMPTSAEMEELLDGTTQTVEKLNGVVGMRFISNVNDSSIFMPFCSYRYGSDVDRVGDNGYLRSSSLDVGYVTNLRCLNFVRIGDVRNSHGLNFYRNGDIGVYDNCHYYGIAVRGVHK